MATLEVEEIEDLLHIRGPCELILGVAGDPILTCSWHTSAARTAATASHRPLLERGSGALHFGIVPDSTREQLNLDLIYTKVPPSSSPFSPPTGIATGGAHF